MPMIHADVIDLINVTYTADAIGQKIPTETTTQTFANIRSVSQSEWFNAGKIGLQPSFVAVTPSANYSGQKELIYHNKRYSVYRTFVRDDDEQIELYLEEKVGS